MLTLRLAVAVAGFAGLGLLIGAVSTPARADPGLGVGGGGLGENALTATGLIAKDSAPGDLNGVVVETVILMQTPEC